MDMPNRISRLEYHRRDLPTATALNGDRNRAREADDSPVNRENRDIF